MARELQLKSERERERERTRKQLEEAIKINRTSNPSRRRLDQVKTRYVSRRATGRDGYGGTHGSVVDRGEGRRVRSGKARREIVV